LIIIENRKHEKAYTYTIGLFTGSRVWLPKSNYANDYKDFYEGHEIIYTGAVGFAIVQPGNLELGLNGKPAPTRA
jgi:hypothetical protein